MSVRGDRARRRATSDAGFTLIEVLVAFVILSLLVTVLLRAVVGLRDGAVSVDVRTRAEIVARAELEDALANRTLHDGTYSGVRDGTRWKLTASSIDLTAQLPPPKPVDKTAAGPEGQQGDPSAPDGNKPLGWATQRVVVDADTGRWPVEVETIRLVKVEQQPPQ